MLLCNAQLHHLCVHASPQTWHWIHVKWVMVNSVTMTTVHHNNPVRTSASSLSSVTLVPAVRDTLLCMTVLLQCYISLICAAVPYTADTIPGGVSVWGSMCVRLKARCVWQRPGHLALLPWPPWTPSSWFRIPTGGNFWNFLWNSPSGWCRSPCLRLTAYYSRRHGPTEAARGNLALSAPPWLIR